METIIFFGIIGVCAIVFLSLFCRLMYLTHKHIQRSYREWIEYKRQKKLEELRVRGAKVFYNIKTRIYTDEYGREIPELEGTLPDGPPPPTDNGIVPIYINKVQ